LIVYVGIPVIDGKPFAALVDSLLAEQLRGFHEGVHFYIDWEIGCSLIGHARNKIANRFLAFKQSDTLVFVDSDISWKGGSLINLARRDQPVVGGTYRTKTDLETVFHVRGPLEPHRDLISVHGLPGGFLKVTRDALSCIQAATYTTLEDLPMHDFFPSGVVDGVYWGEDYGFCQLCLKAGLKLWLDPAIMLRHHDGNRYYEGDPAKWIEERSR
jgi:hypothetical protein